MIFKVNTVLTNFSQLNQSELIATELFLSSLELNGNILLGLKFPSLSSLKIKKILKLAIIKSILDHLPAAFQEKIFTFFFHSEPTSRELLRLLLSYTVSKLLPTKFLEAILLSKFKLLTLKLIKQVLLSVLLSQL